MRARTAIVLAALALAIAGCRESGALDPMSSQRRYGPYEESLFFEDGRAMQRPPAGTVPFAVAPASGPPPVTRALLERGRDRYDVVCATCHGLLGDGRSLVAANMSLRTPPSLHELRGRDAAYFHRITTEGYGLMPAYVAQLDGHDRWAVAWYVLALQRSQSARIEDAPADVRRRLLEESR